MWLIDFLALAPVAAGAPRVVAGAALLDREVRWAHVFETADMSDALSGGEVLLTTRIALAGSEPHRVRTIVADAARQRVTAIALELGSVHRGPPPDLVEVCDRNGPPLIVLDRQVRFVEITRLVPRAGWRARSAGCEPPSTPTAGCCRRPSAGWDREGWWLRRPAPWTHRCCSRAATGR